MAIDFAIIGAPKCGTTSIAYYLSCHPRVDFASIKEPFFYNTQSPGFSGIKDRATYNSLFKNNGCIKGEGSTWYLYSNEAVANILKENEKAKFIICLRNPVDAVVSWHAHMRLVGAENEVSLLKAWHLTDSRLEDNIKIPVYGDACMLDYKGLYKYGDQIERLYKVCNKSQVHIILFDDLCKEPAVVYEKLLKFLDVEHDGRADFPVHYPRVNTKSGLLRYFGSRLSYSSRISITRLALRFGIDLYDMYFRLNTTKAEKQEIPIDVKKELEQHYSPQINKLEQITGIKLTT